MPEPLSKPKARWPQEKQAAFDRLLARVAARADELAITGDDATLTLTLHFHRGHFQSGRFDSDEEFA